MHDYSFYSAILGLSTRWRISDVSVDSQTGHLELHINPATENCFLCSECGSKLRQKGASRGRWLHNFSHAISFYITARVPKVVCDQCGEVQLELPWERMGDRCGRVA